MRVDADILKLQCAYGLWRYVDHAQLDICNIGLTGRSSLCWAAIVQNQSSS